ncbi:uncharacterized protein LOC129601116 isoform X2 [Paramacrobiotus metropolitanus]|uniref:uncharacterized protein LOC129601116 isoform X2 n=1 Tax=Paramacrobiotus metropolitanus TaxID=2943436 RepID=UPI0024461808|nr:uncharacterized protein LOC129601116 isoform X2 [Paramacrobiotus metropolitanus]
MSGSIHQHQPGQIHNAVTPSPSRFQRPHVHHVRNLAHQATSQIKPVVKYRPGILILAAVQIVGGLLILTLEAIGSVLSMVNRGSLKEIDYAGVYVGLFSILTGTFDIVGTRHRLPAFAMSCALAATLVLTTTSWDSIMEFVNRVSKTVDIPLSLATTTTTMTSSLPPNIQAEIDTNRVLLTGVRGSLFVLYFLVFASAVVASCFGCCNFCKCWMRQQTLQLQSDRIATVYPPHLSVTLEHETDRNEKKHRDKRTDKETRKHDDK